MNPAWGFTHIAPRANNGPRNEKGWNSMHPKSAIIQIRPSKKITPFSRCHFRWNSSEKTNLFTWLTACRTPTRFFSID